MSFPSDMTAPPAGALEACLALLKGEGDVKHSTQVRKRRECVNCGEPATKLLSYCYVNGRRNPASSMYGRDDCTYCSDAEVFSCDKCEREVERACCPDGMNWGGTYTANDRYAHMFLHWVETDSPALLAALRLREWIPVSERLPEREGLGQVLAFDADRPGKGVWLETTHPSWWGQFLPDSNEWAPSITHWMPLPAPPTADDLASVLEEG